MFILVKCTSNPCMLCSLNDAEAFKLYGRIFSVVLDIFSTNSSRDWFVILFFA